MGFFSNIKETIAFRKEMKKLIKAYEEKQITYRSLSPEEFQALPDDELYDAAVARVEKTIETFGKEDENIKAALRSLPEPQRVLYTLDYMEREINNGGLCQFFVNSSRNVAPFVSESLDAITAVMHKELFDDFVADNGINVDDLTSFIIYDVEEFEKQCERYPFDDFDEKFYEYGTFQDALLNYIKENIEAF